MSLGQFLLEEKFVWVGGFEGKFSVSFGPNPGFRLWIWTWTKLNNYEYFLASCKFTAPTDDSDF